MGFIANPLGSIQGTVSHWADVTSTIVNKVSASVTNLVTPIELFATGQINIGQFLDTASLASVAALGVRADQAQAVRNTALTIAAVAITAGAATSYFTPASGLVETGLSAESALAAADASIAVGDYGAAAYYTAIANGATLTEAVAASGAYAAAGMGTATGLGSAISITGGLSTIGSAAAKGATAAGNYLVEGAGSLGAKIAESYVGGQIMGAINGGSPQVAPPENVTPTASGGVSPLLLGIGAAAAVVVVALT